MEEFEKAVRMSYRSHRDDVTVSRHSQFVSALEDQISRVETALKESFQVDGKKAFHWVNLDEEECDDLALFLSGSSSQGAADEEEDGTSLLINKKNCRKEDSNLSSQVSSTIQSSDEGKSPQEADRIASNRRTWSPSQMSALEIVIDKDDRQKSAEIEATPKEKGTKPYFWNSRVEGVKGGVPSPPHLNMINWINQVSFVDGSSDYIILISARCTFNFKQWLLLYFIIWHLLISYQLHTFPNLSGYICSLVSIS